MASESTVSLPQLGILCCQEVIPLLDRALADVYADLSEEPMRQAPQLRPYNLGDNKSMRDLNPEGRQGITLSSVSCLGSSFLSPACHDTRVVPDVDQLVAVRGMVIRISSVIPEPSIGEEHARLSSL